MTRTEFFLNAMLQMAANPKYVETVHGEDEKGNEVTFPSLLDECIAIDAEALTKEAEKRYENPFDEDPNGGSFTIGEHLQNISEHLYDIDRSLGDIAKEMERNLDSKNAE